VVGSLALVDIALQVLLLEEYRNFSGGTIMGWQTIVALCVMVPVFMLPIVCILFLKIGVFATVRKMLAKFGI
jgi:hypothetical protein